MINFENTEVMNFEGAIRGMRNPKNSWEKSDSVLCFNGEGYEDCKLNNIYCPRSNDNFNKMVFCIGEDDLALAQTLIKAGSDHRKFMRQILVSVDITAPLYWWKEFDTYKVGTVANSCSTMHKIHSKPIELSDFSIDDIEIGNEGITLKDCFINVVADCEELRKEFLTYDKKSKDTEHFTEAERKDFRSIAKRLWYGLIQLLPESYNQRRTVTLNYEVLRNIYGSRRNHKLDEWSVGFMEWIDSLPYAEELIKYQ